MEDGKGLTWCRSLSSSVLDLLCGNFHQFQAINTLVLWPPHHTCYLSIIHCKRILRLNRSHWFPWVCNQGIRPLGLCATGMEICDGADRDCPNGSSQSLSWFLKVLPSFIISLMLWVFFLGSKWRMWAN